MAIIPGGFYKASIGTLQASGEVFEIEDLKIEFPDTEGEQVFRFEPSVNITFTLTVKVVSMGWRNRPHLYRPRFSLN